jgi:NAD(P)-dependent dehydrogenase (short-subunit alcohol dehydrogenase family)
MRFDGRTCLVTGGAKGIGEAVVKILARNGANVAIFDIQFEKAKALADSLQRTMERRLLAISGNVSIRKDVENAVQEVMREFGRIDILINNAGIWSGGLIVDMKEDDWDAVFDVNVKGVFLTSQAVAKVMMKHGGGRILNIASAAGKGGGTEGWGAYCASKAAVIMLTKVMALELKPYRIWVNSLSPGATKTDLLRRIIDTEGGDYGYAARPEDVAEAAALLVSEEAGDVTGEDFDGPPRVDLKSIRRLLLEAKRRS